MFARGENCDEALADRTDEPEEERHTANSSSREAPLPRPDELAFDAWVLSLLLVDSMARETCRFDPNEVEKEFLIGVLTLVLWLCFCLALDSAAASLEGCDDEFFKLCCGVVAAEAEKYEKDCAGDGGVNGVLAETCFMRLPGVSGEVKRGWCRHCTLSSVASPPTLPPFWPVEDPLTDVRVEGVGGNWAVGEKRLSRNASV